MQKIPLTKAAPGMVLAKAVQRENGVVLMGEGTELTEQLLKKLAELDIKKIAVKGRPLGSGGDDKTLAQLYAELDERFSTASSDRLSVQITELIKKDLKMRSDEEKL